MLISTEKINQIIQKADIVSIISTYIKVQKKGRNYWAVCPFHDDNNPSLSISPDKKIFKCFSCGAGGNVVDFVKNYQHLEFLTALKIVADGVGITLEELNQHVLTSKYSSAMETIFQINADAANFYQVLLAAAPGSEAKQYLTNRNISEKEILKWEIGYATGDIKLHETLVRKGYTIEQLNAAGLISLREGKVYDYFFDRVIFPIKNLDEKIIGFSGRTLTNTSPKYVNTRETLVFKKSNIAFNIAPALKASNLKKSLVVLEGFLDVISLNRIGIENAIAIMGTNLSDEHIKLFKKVNGEIKIFLDGDWAGVNATLKACQKLIQAKIKTSIVDNLTSQDPDELIQKGLRDQVEVMVNHSIHPTIYAVEKLPQFLNLNQPDDLKKYLQQIFALLVLINDVITQEKTLKNLMVTTKLSYETLSQSFSAYQLNHQEVKKDFNFVEPVEIKTKNFFEKPKKLARLPVLKNYEFSQREILHSLITSQRNLKEIEKNLSYIPNADLFVVLQVLIERYQRGTYHENNWQELREILEYSTFDYQDPKWKINPSDLQIAQAQDSHLDDAFLVLQEYKLKKQENYYDQKIKNSPLPELQKKWLKVKEKTRQEIIDLRKKRGNK